jgi:multicomponent Na+:H+ antiporter subunit B
MIKFRLAILAAGVLGLGLLYALGCLHAVGPERLRDRYAYAINYGVLPDRHTQDAVAAVNFDYRALDTLGEECILFVSVMGTLVLLREATESNGEEYPDALDPGRNVGPSDALRAWTLGLTGPTVLFGLYVVTHGHLSPGGGFQGGALLATAPLLIYLAEDYDVFRRITGHRLTELTEAAGITGYLAVGALGWIWGQAFLTNVLPLGTTGNLLSSGTILALNVATGVEVAAGFVLLLTAFLQEILTEGGGEQ